MRSKIAAAADGLQPDIQTQFQILQSAFGKTESHPDCLHFLYHHHVKGHFQRKYCFFFFLKIFLIKTISHEASLLGCLVLFSNWLKIQMLVHEFSVAFAFWCIIRSPPCGWVGVTTWHDHRTRQAFNKSFMKKELCANPPSVLWFHWIKRQGPAVEIWFQVEWSWHTACGGQCLTVRFGWCWSMRSFDADDNDADADDWRYRW